MKTSLIASLILTSLNAQAALDLDIASIGDFNKAEAKVIIALGSFHFDTAEREMLNQINPGVGIELWDIKTVYVNNNSWGKKSLYVAYSPDYVINEHFSISADIGLVSGYKCSNTAKKGKLTLHNNKYCSNSGIIFLPALTIDYQPLANGLALSVSINQTVAMFSGSYEF